MCPTISCMKLHNDIFTEYPSTETAMIISECNSFIQNSQFPCVAAQAALQKKQISFFIADHMACPKDDSFILSFLYDFVDHFRQAETQFQTACVIFKHTQLFNEEMFETLLWRRLQALSDLDAVNYAGDNRVSNDPAAENYSYSLKEEAFYVVGLSPVSSRSARRFKYPALVFNAHAQFEQLRTLHTYEKMKKIIRKKEMQFAGSVNPMLDDFGGSSEAHQYSGMQHDNNWKCPLNTTR